MLITLQGKHVKLSQAAHAYAEKFAEKLLEKYHLCPTSLHGTLDKDLGKSFVVTLALHLGKDWTGRISSRGQTAYQALKNAFHCLAQRLKAQKKRAVDHHRHHDNHHFISKIKMEERLRQHADQRPAEIKVSA